MNYFDRPPAGQQGSCARNSRPIAAIRRATGSTLSVPFGKE